MIPITQTELGCTCSARAVWAACRLHWLCSVGCNYTAISLECNCSVQTCYHKRRHSQCGLGTLQKAVHPVQCTSICSVSAVFLQAGSANCSMQCVRSVLIILQPPLQIHSMYWSVSAMCTSGHCRYTAVRSGYKDRVKNT